MNNLIDFTDLQLNEETVVQINRVSKATTGGRRMRFSAIVVVDTEIWPNRRSDSIRWSFGDPKNSECHIYFP